MDPFLFLMNEDAGGAAGGGDTGGTPAGGEGSGEGSSQNTNQQGDQGGVNADKIGSAAINDFLKRHGAEGTKDAAELIKAGIEAKKAAEAAKVTAEQQRLEGKKKDNPDYIDPEVVAVLEAQQKTQDAFIQEMLANTLATADPAVLKALEDTTPGFSELSPAEKYQAYKSAKVMADALKANMPQLTQEEQKKTPNQVPGHQASSQPPADVHAKMQTLMKRAQAGDSQAQREFLQMKRQFPQVRVIGHTNKGPAHNKPDIQAANK